MCMFVSFCKCVRFLCWYGLLRKSTYHAIFLYYKWMSVWDFLGSMFECREICHMRPEYWPQIMYLIQWQKHCFKENCLSETFPNFIYNNLYFINHTFLPYFTWKYERFLLQYATLWQGANIKDFVALNPTSVFNANTSVCSIENWSII